MFYLMVNTFSEENMSFTFENRSKSLYALPDKDISDKAVA